MNQRILSLFLMACIYCLIGCKKKNDISETEMGIMPICVATPIVKDVTLTREYPGYLSADAAVDVVCQVNGQLIQSNVSAGQRVNKGDILYIIDPTLYRDIVKQAFATLKTAEAELSYAQSSYIRMQEVIKSEAVSEIEDYKKETQGK